MRPICLCAPKNAQLVRTKNVQTFTIIPIVAHYLDLSSPTGQKDGLQLELTVATCKKNNTDVPHGYLLAILMGNLQGSSTNIFLLMRGLLLNSTPVLQILPPRVVNFATTCCEFCCA